MYLPSDEQCAANGGQTGVVSPISAADLQAQANALNSVSSAMDQAQSAFDALLNRTWQSFADLGPNVALQLLNPANIPGTYTRSNSASPSSAGSTSNESVPGNGLTQQQLQQVKQFQDTFGTSATPWKTYVGKRPVQGTVESLLYGGSNRPIDIGTGKPLGAPDPRYGYDCSASSNATSVPGASTSPSMIALGLVALVGLVGISYAMEQHHARRKAAA